MSFDLFLELNRKQLIFAEDFIKKCPKISIDDHSYIRKDTFGKVIAFQYHKFLSLRNLLLCLLVENRKKCLLVDCEYETRAFLGRTIQDIYSACLSHLHQIPSLAEVYNGLFGLLKDRILQSYICKDINKRVWFVPTPLRTSEDIVINFGTFLSRPVDEFDIDFRPLLKNTSIVHDENCKNLSFGYGYRNTIKGQKPISRVVVPDDSYPKDSLFDTDSEGLFASLKSHRNSSLLYESAIS